MRLAGPVRESAHELDIENAANKPMATLARRKTECMCRESGESEEDDVGASPNRTNLAAGTAACTRNRHAPTSVASHGTTKPRESQRTQRSEELTSELQ